MWRRETVRYYQSVVGMRVFWALTLAVGIIDLRVMHAKGALPCYVGLEILWKSPHFLLSLLQSTRLVKA